MKERTYWKIKEWNEYFCSQPLLPMTEKETREAIKWLRDNNYPKPYDCDEVECPVRRPACLMGVCRVAVGMCGDF